MLLIFIFNYVIDGMNLKVFVGFCRLLGLWKWNSGEFLLIIYLVFFSIINNYDMLVILCIFDYCGIFYVNFFVDLRVFDNCCNNFFLFFICFIVI